MPKRRRTAPKADQRHLKGCPEKGCDCPWTIRFRDGEGKQHRVTEDTEEEAWKAYHVQMGSSRGPLADTTTTIAQWAQRWQDGATTWRRGTRQAREQTVRLHIEPYLGRFLVTELTRDQVREWAAGMRDRGASAPTMRKAVSVLRAMYGVWQEDGRHLPHGIPIPGKLVKQPPRKEFTPLTDAQVQEWAAAMPPEMSVMVEVEAFYGSRQSEILGLREEHIIWTGKDVKVPLAGQLADLAALPPDKYDQRRPQVRFQEQLERITRVAVEMKNREANRTLPLPQWLAVKLAAQFAQWPPAGGYLFVNLRAKGSRRPFTDEERRHSKPYNSQTHDRALRGAAKDAGIELPPRQCSHALRHHRVSVLRADGWSDQVIGKWIGDTAETVMRTYGRPMPGSLDQIASALTARREDTRPPLRAV